MTTTTTTTKTTPEAQAMPIADRLEHCAKFTGLDAVRELLLEAAGAVRKRDAVILLLEGEVAEAARPAEVTEPALLGAIARGWCHPKNSGKEVDADLAEAIAEEIRAILALRPVQVPMTGWQPIETAPNTGAFLAVLDCGGDQTICTMRHGVIASKNSRPDGDFIRERVTHWMPLPPLPKSTQTGITAQAKKETP